MGTTNHTTGSAGIDLAKLQRYDHQGCCMAPDATGDYLLISDVRDLLARRATLPSAKDERALIEARDAINNLLHRFTGTPSTYAESNARVQGHAAIRAIDAALTSRVTTAEQQAVPAHLIVSTAAGADQLTVLVSVKRGDITTVVYSRHHSMNGASMGVERIPAGIIAPPAATTASASDDVLGPQVWSKQADMIASWSAPAPSRDAALPTLPGCLADRLFEAISMARDSAENDGSNGRIRKWEATAVDLRAALAQQGAAQGDDMLSSAEFLAKRLMRVARAVGAHVPEHFTDTQIAQVAPTILGEVARVLEKRAAQAQAGEVARDAARLDFIENNTVDLRCHDAPTPGGDDADVYWTVIEHHMAKPHEREIGWGSTARKAIDAAMAAQATNKGKS